MSAWILLGLILTCTLPGQSQPADNFSIEGAGPEIYARARVTLLSAKAELAEMLDEQLTDSIRVFLASNRNDFDTAAFGGVPDWGAGVAIPSENYISILIPGGEESAVSFEEVLRHELAHLALYKRTDGKRIPRFISEGFAMMFAHQWSFGDDITLAKARLTGSLFALPEIDGVNMLNSEQARIAYSQSYLAVKYIIDTYQKKTFLALLDGFRAGQTPDLAFKNVMGVDFAGFDKLFADYLKSNYHWIMILTDPIFLWIALVFLFLLGYILIRRRNRRIYRKWEEEEKLESTDFDYEESSPWD